MDHDVLGDGLIVLTHKDLKVVIFFKNIYSVVCAALVINF